MAQGVSRGRRPRRSRRAAPHCGERSACNWQAAPGGAAAAPAGGISPQARVTSPTPVARKGSSRTPCQESCSARRSASRYRHGTSKKRSWNQQAAVARYRHLHEACGQVAAPPRDGQVPSARCCGSPQTRRTAQPLSVSAPPPCVFPTRHESAIPGRSGRREAPNGRDHMLIYCSFQQV